MAALPNCPLDSETLLGFRFPPQPRFGFSCLQAIENHISTDNCTHPALKEFVFDGSVKGTTPLVLACYYEQFESVKHIVESWGVDVRAAAPYYCWPEPYRCHMELLVESATPLFVAALQGNSRIVRYLLEKGADVTTKTSNKAKREYDGLTPLCGAVMRSGMRSYRRLQPDEQRAERNAIVLSLLEFGADISASHRPLWINSRLIGIDTTMTLINHGLDVKQRDYWGSTALHHWANVPLNFTERESLTIVKLLIEKGADVMARDNDGFTPIMAAANSLHLLDFTVLDFFLEREDIAIMEKIEAMELAGANILLYQSNAPQYPMAFDYWRRATRLRQTEGSGCYQKKLAQKTVGTVEWTTLDQLERIIQHPIEIQIQLVLVQLRIISSRSWEGVHKLLVFYMSDPGLSLLYMEEKRIFDEKLVELLDIHWAMLDTIFFFQPNEKGFGLRSVDVVRSIVVKLVYILSTFRSSNPTITYSEKIKESLRLIITAMDKLRLLADPELETYIKKRLYRGLYYPNAMFEFLKMLIGLPEMLDDLWGSLLQVFGRLGRNKLGSLLLRACKDYNNAYYSVIIKLLLQLGANVDSANRDGNRPLHLVAMANSEQSDVTGCLLLGYGAQLFRTNKSGKTALDLWIERNEMEDDQEGEEGAAESRGRPDWCRTVPKLLCLSARCIRTHAVPIEDQPEFFKDSHSFIKKH